MKSRGRRGKEATCEYELGERQNGRAFCSKQDNWCSRQNEPQRCPLRRR